MTKATSLAIAVMLLSACKGKGDDKKGATDPGTASATAPATLDAGAAAAAPDGATAAAGSDPRCETQCRFLANTPLDNIATYYQEACGTAWVAPAADDCDALDYQRNCIYATAGYTFKKAKWQDTFGKLPWYKARPDFKETDLSRIATANIRELKQAALTCRGEKTGAIPSKFPASKLSAADQKTIVAWFAKKAKGELVLPAKLEADFQPATPEQMKTDWFAHEHLFTLEEWTPMEYRDGPAKPGEPRTVYVGTSTAGPDCVDEGGEECEGFEVIYFDLDAKGAIVGISVTAAACPLVYLEGPGGALSYQGEILRYLGRPSFERTEELRLDALPACAGGEVRIQLVEAKDEITYLDDVALVIDGTAIAPRACAEDGAAPAYCAEDGRHLTLSRGQTLSLVFDIPSSARCTAPALRANGHYISVP